MKPLQFARPGEQMKVLCLGAHSDDIEIGAGATLLGLIARGVRLDVHWVVLSATPERAHEARSAAEEILQGAAEKNASSCASLNRKSAVRSSILISNVSSICTKSDRTAWRS